MSAKIVVSVQDVSKAYLLYKRPQDRLKQSLFYRFGRNYAHTFWALRDISFEVFRGETIGIIGRNGSGKSTLLQIITNVLQPTSGNVSVEGRVSALLELGAGFSPEFTGRENIYLSGSVLGIPEKEMRNRIDQIIDFAQIGEFLEQPVKLYSSGMYVRLAFSIAASIDPDVLVIDEALAVGDAGFVIKCTQRMRHLKERGTTIILVSHDVHAIRSFCDRAIWLQEGRIKSQGSTLDVTSQYVQSLLELTTEQKGILSGEPEISSVVDLPVKRFEYVCTNGIPRLVRWGSGEILIEGFYIDNGEATNSKVFIHGQHLQVGLKISTRKAVPKMQIGVGISFRNMYGLDIITSTTLDQGLQINPPQEGQSLQVVFELTNILCAGDYALVLNVEERLSGVPKYFDFIENALVFKVITNSPVFSLVLPEVVQKVIPSEQ